jgi:maltooligosyltrehalose trehalohydrolase
MHAFNVWAPRADSVDVIVDGRRVPMARGDGGSWAVSDALAKAGARYGYALDGGPARPDPRSGSQPDGVLGLSELVDHDAHDWSDGSWPGLKLAGSVLYELHPGTFTPAGTFDGVIERLPHLKSLGVSAIELMPVAEFSGDRGWGYDGVDLFAPHHAYGGPDGLKRLVAACHASCLGVLLDVVYNHLGPVGNFLSEYGPYFSDTHLTGWGAGMNFDGPGSGEVRRFVIDNAIMWLRDYHVDGLRLDAVHAIVDNTPTHVLEQLATEVQALGAQLGRSFLLVAESELNDPRFVRSREAGGYGLDGVWSDDWHHALHTALTGERTGYYEDFGSMKQLAKALRQAWVFDGQWSAHRKGIRGMKAAGVASESFVIALQNHDQVGNRAAGERLAALIDEGKLKVAAALLLTSPFTPMIFQGEEWASGSPFQFFTDHADQELGVAVREGRAREFAAFGWDPRQVPDPQDPATFSRSKLDWREVDEPEHGRMLAWYRSLIGLRKRLDATAAVRVEVDEGARHIDLQRGGIRVLANLGDADWQATVPAGAHILLASDPGIERDGGRVCVPPSSVVIVENTGG